MKPHPYGSSLGSPIVGRLWPWLISGVVAVGLAGSIAIAQDYPTQKVTMVVPTGPGGGMEMMARMFATHMEQRLGKPFVIENRAGAGGVLGTNAVAKAVPDGYTLLVANSTNLAINVSLYKSLPYGSDQGTRPCPDARISPWVLVVNPSLQVNSVGDLVCPRKVQA